MLVSSEIKCQFKLKKTLKYYKFSNSLQMEREWKWSKRKIYILLSNYYSFRKTSFPFSFNKILKVSFSSSFNKKSCIFCSFWKWEIATNDRKLQTEVWIVFWTYLVCSSIYFFVTFTLKNSTLIHYRSRFLFF